MNMPRIHSTERDVIDLISEGSLIFIGNGAVNHATNIEGLNKLIACTFRTS
jgi:hypothetical protein